MTLWLDSRALARFIEFLLFALNAHLLSSSALRRS